MEDSKTELRRLRQSRFVHVRLWSAMRELRSHLFLLRLMPFRSAFSLLWNRFRYGFAVDPHNLNRLNEKKHRLIDSFLKGFVFADVSEDIHYVKNAGVFPAPPIWVCWLQGEPKMPELNQLCVESIRRFSGGHPVVFLSAQDIPTYLTIPQSIHDAYLSRRIKPAIYTDYVRCALLSIYGGLWLDSTILLTKPIGEEWFRSAFMSVKMKEENNKSVSRYRWATFCLGSVPGSPFFIKVEQMFRAYFERVDKNVDYLMIDYFFDLLCQKDSGMKELIDQLPETNPSLHELRSLLNDVYDSEKMKAMEKTTSIYKLTYKMDLQESRDGVQTYWGYLKQHIPTNSD